MFELALQLEQFRGLLFFVTVVMAVGFLLTMHGAAAYALLLWQWTAGATTWVYVDPILGGFFFLAGILQFPIATHIWGDPLREQLRQFRSGPF